MHVWVAARARGLVEDVRGLVGCEHDPLRSAKEPVFLPLPLNAAAVECRPPLHPPLHLPRSKFVSGVLGSRTSPTMLLAGGLMATAALNVAFGFSTSLVWFCTWWAMNGMLQVGWAGLGRVSGGCIAGTEGRDARTPIPPPSAPPRAMPADVSLPTNSHRAAGRGRALLRPHPHLLVCGQGARHVLVRRMAGHCCGARVRAAGSPASR